jgi:hypothetical protein
MKVWIKWTNVDYDILELGTNELVDGCFHSIDDAKQYCKDNGYVVISEDTCS